MTERQKEMKFKLYQKIDDEIEKLQEMQHEYMTEQLKEDIQEQLAYIDFLNSREQIIFNFNEF